MFYIIETENDLNNFVNQLPVRNLVELSLKVKSVVALKEEETNDELKDILSSVLKERGRKLCKD